MHSESSQRLLSGNSRLLRIDVLHWARTPATVLVVFFAYIKKLSVSTEWQMFIEKFRENLSQAAALCALT